MTGDGIDSPVSWTGGADISALSETFARLEIELRDAKIYSFRVADN